MKRVAATSHLRILLQSNPVKKRALTGTQTRQALSLYYCGTKLTACQGEIHRVRESKNPSKVILVILRESYGEIGRVPVNLSIIRFSYIIMLKINHFNGTFFFLISKKCSFRIHVQNQTSFFIKLACQTLSVRKNIFYPILCVLIQTKVLYRFLCLLYQDQQLKIYLTVRRNIFQHFLCCLSIYLSPSFEKIFCKKSNIFTESVFRKDLYFFIVNFSKQNTEKFIINISANNLYDTYNFQTPKIFSI